MNAAAPSAVAALAAALDGAPAQGMGWPEALPLHRELLPAEVFPVDALGPVLAPAVEVIGRVVQSPVAVAAQAVLAAAGLAAQGHADVELDGRRVPLALYLLSVAESGSRKTGADRVALHPVRTVERELHAQHRIAKSSFESRALAWRRASEAAAKAGRTLQAREEALAALGPAPEPPALPLLVTTEPTFEGLLKLFTVGRPSLGLFSDEGGGFLGGHAMSPDHRLRALTGLSDLHDGKPISRVRSGDGAGVLFGRRLALHLMVQPVVAPALLGDRLALEQGFVPRCLVVWPESTLGRQVYVAEDPTSAPGFTNFERVMLHLLREPFLVSDDDGRELRPRQLPLAPAAKAIWIRFHDWACHHNGAERALEPVRSFAAKVPDHALRLAGVTTIASDPEAGEISLERVEAALVLARHYLGEALRLHGQAAVDGDLLLASRLLAWTRAQGGRFSLVDAYQRGPAAVRDRATAGRLVEILEAHGWCRRLAGGAEVNGVRRRDVWEVRP